MTYLKRLQFMSGLQNEWGVIAMWSKDYVRYQIDRSQHIPTKRGNQDPNQINQLLEGQEMNHTTSKRMKAISKMIHFQISCKIILRGKSYLLVDHVIFITIDD